MAISGKPQKIAPAVELAKTPSEQEVFDLINQGGGVPKAAPSKAVTETIKPMLVQLRLYPDLVKEIDAVREAVTGRGKRRPCPSRHAWIVNAIEEKLARDKPNT